MQMLTGVNKQKKLKERKLEEEASTDFKEKAKQSRTYNIVVLTFEQIKNYAISPIR